MYKIYKAIYDWCDKLEDHVRGYLSHYPIVYAFVGATGIVIFWRGVWLTMDAIMFKMTSSGSDMSTINFSSWTWWDGPLSIIIGSVILLMSGVFVSNFIGNEIIISGLKGEKKIAEKTEKEVKSEEDRLSSVREQIASIHHQMSDLKIELDKILEAETKRQ